MATNPKSHVISEKKVWSKCSLYSPIERHDVGDNGDGYYDHRVRDDDHDNNEHSNL